MVGMGEDLVLRAIDIETTGFEIDDAVTVFGIERPLGCRVFCLRPADDVSRSAGEVTASVEAAVPTNVTVSLHASESGLLEAVGAFIADHVRDENVLLVAYNGERFRSGFDLPFLRSRLAMTGVEWPFTGLPYADLMPIMTRLFNTTVDGDEQSDLVSVYDLLCDGELSRSDPFDESQEAVEAFEAGRIDAVATHCTVDVLRTSDLGALAQEYCGRTDFELKSLTPAIDASET